MSATGKMRDNVQLVSSLIEGLKLPGGIRLIEADTPVFLTPTPTGIHRANFVTYLWKPAEKPGHLYVRAVPLGFMQFAQAETSDGLDWALSLARKVEDAAKLLELEIERGEATMIEDGGFLPSPD